MASNNIIIESNRRIAYAEQEESRLKEKSSIFDTGDEYPVHRWSTNIPEGIRIDPGDRVSLEGAMINQVGGGGSVIEFTGDSGQSSGTNRLADNSAKMRLGYYVTNNQSNNFNNPKSIIQVNYDYRRNMYGGPAIYADSLNLYALPATEQQNFQAFNRCYPYQFIESSITTFNRITKEWFEGPPDTEVYPIDSDLLPSFSKGGTSVILTDSTKMYVGPKNYLGPYYIDTQTDTTYLGVNAVNPQYKHLLNYAHSIEPFMETSFWDFFSTNVLLTQDKGFVNPSSLASNLTNLLHQRDGTASYWNNKEYEALLLTITGPGNGSSQGQTYSNQKVPAITDATYKTLPTSTGKPIYQFLQGQEAILNATAVTPLTPEQILRSWYSTFTVDNNQSALGTGYVGAQALMTFYSHELTSRPMYMKGMSRLIQTSQRKPASQYTTQPVANTDPEWIYYNTHFYLHTATGILSAQTYKGVLYQIGGFNNSIVILDNLPSIQQSGFAYFSNVAKPFFPDIRHVELLPTNMLKLERGIVIATNMLWNPDMLEMLGEIYSEYFEVVSDTVNTNINSQEFIDAHAIRLNIGRLDDQLSVPAPASSTRNLGGLTHEPTSNWKSMYLPCPYNIIAHNPLTDPGFTQQPSGYRDVINTDYTDPDVIPNSSTRVSLMGGFFGEENELLVELILPKDFTAQDAYDGTLPRTQLLIGPNRTVSSSPAFLDPPIDFKTYKRLFWDTIPTLANGAKLAIIPLFGTGTETGARTILGTNGRNCCFVGYIMRGRPEGHIQNIPLPSIGEYFGFSPSQLTTGSGQLVSTQKVLRNSAYPTPGINNLGGILTQQINNSASGFAWVVGDIGTIIATPNAGLPPMPGSGATFVIKTMNPGGTGGAVPAEITILDSGGGYELYSTYNRAYTCVGVGDDFSIRVLTVVTNPNVGGGDASAYDNVKPDIYYPYLNVGAEDSAIVFDGASSKFAIKQFHTPTTKGNGLFQRPDYPINTIDPEQHILSCGMKTAGICGTRSTGDATIGNAQSVPEIYFNLEPLTEGHPTRSAQAGVSILDISPLINTGMPVNTEDSVAITINNEPLYDNTLMSKMGFEWEQLCPVYGKPNNDFNRGSYNEYLGFGEGINVRDKYLNMVKPFTTNAYIDATIAFSLAKLNSRTFDPGDEFDTEIFELVPSFNLGGMPDDNVSITNASSDALIARNSADKLAFPYLVVYTNIINNVDYFGGPNGNSKLPAIAYITRNYAQGDFFFSTQSDYSFIADSTYIISRVITDIRLPNGDPAPIDGNSSIIYKIVKGKAMPPTPEQMAEATKQEKKTK